MEKKDIEHLAALSRIELSEEEKDSLAHSISDILTYVGQVKGIAATEKEKKAVGVHNVLRDDTPTHEPEAFTDAILAAAPAAEGRYVKVKKILGGAEESN